MNTLFLVAATIVVFVFGYRFYAKLLALDVFRLDKNYSTPARTRADGRDFVSTNRHLLFGHHVAALGVLACLGPVLAIAWGWIPAFLWITIGSTVAAGTYAFGSYWLCAHQTTDVTHTARRLIGLRAHDALFALALLVLLLWVALAVGIVASTLTAYPAATLPILGIILIALAVGAFLHGRAEFEILPTTLIALASTLLLIWICARTPLAFNGALSIVLGGTSLASIDGISIWVVMALLYGMYAARAPIWQLTRPRGFLTGVLVAVVLLTFFLALAIEQPAMVAPQFHETSNAPLPWLFLIMTSGALAGFPLLVIYGVTGRQMRNELDASYLGYGGAIAEGAIALTALLIAATLAVDSEAARKLAVAAVGPIDFALAVTVFVDGYARLIATLGMDVAFARNLAAVMLASLGLAALEAGMRALKHLLASPVPTAGKTNTDRSRLWGIAAAAAVIALHDGHGLGGFATGSLLAMASWWLAASGFALIALALRSSQRSATLLWSLALAAAVIAGWASVMQLVAWWDTDAWGKLLLGAIVIASALTLLVGTAQALRQAPSGTVRTELDS